MPLIDKPYIRQNFPQAEEFASYDPVAGNTDAAIDNQIVNAEDELADYVTVTDETITKPITRHLFNITRYNIFMLRHADTNFDRTPDIVRAYEHTIKMLEQLRDGDRPAIPSDPGDARGVIRIRAKRRRFDSWFSDTGGDMIDSTDQ